MKHYERGLPYFIVNLVDLKATGFPRALQVSLPPSILAGVLVALVYDFDVLPDFKPPDAVMNNNAVWAGFSFLVGFLVVFRTSQAYNRFWEGVTSARKMGASWFHCCAALMSFCKVSNAEEEQILLFKNKLIRLFSMLHATALGAIEDRPRSRSPHDIAAFRTEIIDGDCIDIDSMKAIRNCDCRVQLIYQWIQELIIENIGTGVLSVAPPILTRSFQEIATGSLYFNDALTISKVEFPFPYAVTCDRLLVLHWLIVPWVVSQWCTKSYWAVIFTFIQVFTLWSLNMIAVELENPFGADPNDMDGNKMQRQMNSQLRLLCHGATMSVPSIGRKGEQQAEIAARVTQRPVQQNRRGSLMEVWEEMCDNDAGPVPSRSAINLDMYEGREGEISFNGFWEPCDGVGSGPSARYSPRHGSAYGSARGSEVPSLSVGDFASREGTLMEAIGETFSERSRRGRSTPRKEGKLRSMLASMVSSKSSPREEAAPRTASTGTISAVNNPSEMTLEI